VNSAITIEPRVLDLDADTARTLAVETDLLLDATDSFAARYLINDAAVAADTPWIYSAVVGAEGMTLNCHTMLTADELTPCLRCIWPDPAPPGMAATCDTVGVLNGAVSAVSGLAATEAIKILIGSSAISRDLRSFDLWQGAFESVTLPRDLACPACAMRQFAWLDGTIPAATALLCGGDTVQVRPEQLQGAATGAFDLAALAQRWDTLGAVTLAPGNVFARLRLDAMDITVFPDGRALIRGVADVGVARSLYTRYVGM
jgi:adenylyltransferase/sulfurtransferase